MSTIVPFDFGQNKVRIVMIDGEPWFVVNDVCAVLGIKDSSDAASRIDEDDRGQTPVDHGRGARPTNVVNESGLYELIFRSDKPEAKKFRRWITKEVLPSLRKTGTYSINKDLEELELAKRYLAALEERLALKAKIAEDAPKVKEHEEFLDYEGLYTLAQTAQLLYNGGDIELGLARLTKRLRGLGILCKETPPRPKQQYLELGWFEVLVKPLDYQYYYGSYRKTYARTYVTPEGLSSLYKELSAAGDEVSNPLENLDKLNNLELEE